MTGETRPDDVCEVICFDEEKVTKLKKAMPPMYPLANVFKVLADQTRVGILYVLSKEELCVCDISAVLGSSVSNISHHLQVLRSARLVKHRKEGKQVYYRLDDDHVLHIIRECFEHVGHASVGG